VVTKTPYNLSTTKIAGFMRLSVKNR